MSGQWWTWCVARHPGQEWWWMGWRMHHIGQLMCGRGMWIGMRFLHTRYHVGGYSGGGGGM